MPVVSKNFVGRSHVLVRERSTPLADRQELFRKRASRLLAPDPLQPLFGRMADGGCHRFARERRELAHELLGRGILDIERHKGILAEIICQ